MKIRNLAIYPVKSCGGIELDSGMIFRSGLSFNGHRDHQYMVVSAEPESGVYNFLTQRDPRTITKEGSDKVSQMAMIKPVIVNGSIRLTWGYAEAIEIPEGVEGQEITVGVWSDHVSAVDKGKEIAEWLSDHLGIRSRLVESTGAFHRKASQDYGSNDNHVKFHDSYPIHWFSIESVNELSERTGLDIQWQSFRPQIVVEGGEPRSEHDIEYGEFGSVDFLNSGPCYRCPITLIDPETGLIREYEPLRTLAEYKNWKNKNGKRKVIFGEYALPQEIGKVSVGDDVIANSMRLPPLKYGTLEEIK